MCRKIPKTLSGIETQDSAMGAIESALSRKIPKTLSGIETTGVSVVTGPLSAGKYLKPYQGLKQIFVGVVLPF